MKRPPRDNELQEIILKGINLNEQQKDLLNSAYACQCRDYIMLIRPDNFIADFNPRERLKEEIPKYVPCDYKLANLIHEFWNQGIQTFYSEQGSNKMCGQIDFHHRTIHNEHIVDVLNRMYDCGEISGFPLKKNDKFVLESVPDPENSKSITWSGFNEMWRGNEIGHYTLKFKTSLLQWLHNKIGVKMATKKEALPGYQWNYNWRLGIFYPTNIKTIYKLENTHHHMQLRKRKRKVNKDD